MDWYGQLYPSLGDLESAANGLGVPVAYHHDFDVPRAFWHTTGEPWFIGVPSQFGYMARCWAVAHELGHLVIHDGPAGLESWRLQEDEADHWAACAMLPAARIEAYGGSPGVGHLLAALRKHYQPFGGPGDSIRKLACRIAYTRLEALRRTG